jgi:hypothetical protein
MILNTKIVFYTCLFGRYDFISKPNKELVKKFNFYIITNQNCINLKNWKKIYVNNKNLSNFLLSRYYKFFFHQKIKKYDYSVYLDANVHLKNNFIEILNKFINSNKEIGLFKHSSRKNIYQELNSNLENKNIKNIDKEKILKFYKKNKYNSFNDLSENCVILRKHNAKKLFKTMRCWWRLLRFYIKRDQISLPYALWKYKISKIVFNVDLRKQNKYLFIVPHYRFNIIQNFKTYLYVNYNFIFKILNYFKEKKFR